MTVTISFTTLDSSADQAGASSRSRRCYCTSDERGAGCCGRALRTVRRAGAATWARPRRSNWTWGAGSDRGEEGTGRSASRIASNPAPPASPARSPDGEGARSARGCSRRTPQPYLVDTTNTTSVQVNRDIAHDFAHDPFTDTRSAARIFARFPGLAGLTRTRWPWAWSHSSSVVGARSSRLQNR